MKLALGGAIPLILQNFALSLGCFPSPVLTGSNAPPQFAVINSYNSFSGLSQWLPQAPVRNIPVTRNFNCPLMPRSRRAQMVNCAARTTRRATGDRPLRIPTPIEAPRNPSHYMKARAPTTARPRTIDFSNQKGSTNHVGRE